MAKGHAREKDPPWGRKKWNDDKLDWAACRIARAALAAILLLFRA